MIEITILSNDEPRTLAGISTPCILGRRANAEHPELVLADPFVSRQHIELNETDSGDLRVRCVGKGPVRLSDGKSIEINQERLLKLPVELRVGRSKILVAEMKAGMTFLRPSMTIEGSVAVPDSSTRCKPVKAATGSRFAKDESVAPQRLIQWFENLVALQESVSGLRGLYAQAAKAVVDLIGLDRCVVLRCNDDKWSAEAEHGQCGSGEVLFSHSVVDLVRSHHQTVFDSSVDFSTANSLTGVSAFVGSPIVDSDGTVVACLFGVRRSFDIATTGVLPIEAQLVQVIAGIVSARIGRMEAEAEQVRAQVQLEQFASPALVREMQANPQWLDANQRELTLMFGDIREFSALSQRLTPHQTYALVRDVMDCLTEIIHRHGGFIINYAGDGIAAMWNAPELSSHHAQDACSAAVEIQQQLPDVVQHWKPIVGDSIRVGLGINTGKAIIGNSGSKLRLKYSPLGHHVNLASRVEGATKYFGVSTLITRSTREQIDDSFVTRELGEIAVVGIDQGVYVYQLKCDSETDDRFWKEFEIASRLYRSGDFEASDRHAQEILSGQPDDVSTKRLIDLIKRSDGVVLPFELLIK